MNKALITAADLLYDKVPPFYTSHDLPMLHILRIAILSIVTMSPQANGTCECFHKTIVQEFYQNIFRKNVIPIWISQKDLDEWLDDYNKEEYIKVRFVMAERRWKRYSIENFFGMANF